MILNSFDIAQNIRLVRETKGLTIEKLAELAGVSGKSYEQSREWPKKFKYGVIFKCITGIRCISGFLLQGQMMGKETKNIFRILWRSLKTVPEEKWPFY